MSSDMTGNIGAPAAAMRTSSSVGPIAGESAYSGVSWAAIFAGGVAAAALTIILGFLGAGLGLISVSPWQGHGASAETIGFGVIIWSIVVEVAAFGLGGYLAGRLRTKWANIHGDEVYFRDTAHGFVTWALGTLVSLAIMTSVAGHLARTTAEIGAAAAAGAAAGGGGALAMNAGPDGDAHMRGNPMDYYIDMLFRPAAGGTTTAGAASATATPAPANAGSNDSGPVRAEIGRIVASSFTNGEITLSAPDRTYIGQLIAQRTGLSQADAEKRIDDVAGQAKSKLQEAEAKVKQAADDARKAAAAIALWTFISLLIGAFAASYAATLGGRRRDL